MAPLRILVVDDCHDTADTMLALLRLWGYEGIAAYDGANAFDLARRHRPDLALLDVAMPRERDGYALARQLREDVPLLVAVTGYADVEHRGQCEQAGFDLVLAKPLDHERFQKLLAEAARLIAETRRLVGHHKELVAQARRRYGDFLVQWRRHQELADRAREISRGSGPGRSWW
jgi:CheY-like chemotaxis protein